MDGLKSFATNTVLCAFLFAPSAMAGAWGDIEPRNAVDLNPASGVVEYVIVAKEHKVQMGKKTKAWMWTYNGSMPGPTLQGNVGDTMIVHFYNQLPEETTLHWHGMEVPANMDGSNISQHAVPPGGYFRYEFKLLRASLFWYHPHIKTNEQLERGLYGALIVRDPDEDERLGLPKQERILLLDDVLLDEDGQVAAPYPDDPLQKALTQVNGRHGNVLLVNGRTAQKSWVRRGEPQRLRLVNTSNSRFQRISITGHRMWRIGGDGGLLETPIEMPPVELVEDPGTGELISDPDPAKGLLLTPGERADVIFTPVGDGPIHIEWHDIARGRHSAFYKPDGSIGLGHDHHDGKHPPQSLLQLRLIGRPLDHEYIPPPQLRTIEPQIATSANTIDVRFGHTPPDENGNVIFFAAMKDGMPLPFSGVSAGDAPIAMVGETRIIEVTNMTGGDHNFHLHGFMFQLIETEFFDMDEPQNNYVLPAPYLEDKDTIFIPRRPGSKGRSKTISRLAVAIDDTGREGQAVAFGKTPGDDFSGGWIYHCHILEHANRGMMSFLQVIDP